MGGEGKIIHYSHSIGTAETLCALKLLTEAERKVISVYSFGSPSLPCGMPQFHHFVSVRDPICYLDLVGLIQAIKGKNPCVTFVGKLCGVPNHLISCHAYRDVWEAMGKTFVEWYGSLN